MLQRLQDHEKAELLKPFFSRLMKRDSLSANEQRIIIEAADSVRIVPAKTDFVREGDLPDHSTLILEGVAARFSMLEDGGRQITAFQIAGDFVDLHSFLLKHMDHGITAMTDVHIMAFPHHRLKEITERHAHLTRLLWFSTLVDGALSRQWLVAMGRMSGLQHMAHLFCEQFIRSQAAGLTKLMSFPFILTQTDLSDALGLSSVHTNRVLQELRSSQLVEWDGKTLQIRNWDELQRIAMFDPAYLHLERVNA